MLNEIYSKQLSKIYDKLFGNQAQDLEFYKHFIKQNKGPALEIGSGTGRLLIPYLKENLQIEGIEPRKDMIKICMGKAKKLSLKPIIYQQKLESLSLQKKYKTIYLPLYVYQHITQKKDAMTSLKKCHAHLEPGGQILISIFIPLSKSETKDWQKRTAYQNKNETIILSEKNEMDNLNQIQKKGFKYEIFKNNELTKTYFSSQDFKIYSKDELTLLLEQAGFKKIEIFENYILNSKNMAHKKTGGFIFIGTK